MNSESDKFQKSRPVEPVRVLLIYPPSRSQMHESCPAALMMLGVVLEQAGVEVRVLDADFFRYPPQVRKRIRRVFRFMYLHNRRRSNRLLRWAHRTMLDVSEWTHRCSPCLERLIFAPVTAAEQAFGRR